MSHTTAALTLILTPAKDANHLELEMLAQQMHDVCPNLAGVARREIFDSVYGQSKKWKKAEFKTCMKTVNKGSCGKQYKEGTKPWNQTDYETCVGALNNGIVPCKLKGTKIPFPKKCLDDAVLALFWNETTWYEQQLLPEFFNSPIGLAPLTGSFLKRNASGEYCSIDVDATFQSGVFNKYFRKKFRCEGYNGTVGVVQDPQASSSDIAVQSGVKESAMGGRDAISSVAKQHDGTSGHRRDEAANGDSGDTRSIEESKAAVMAPNSRQGDKLRSDDDDTAKADNEEEKATAEALKFGLEDKGGGKEDKGGSNDDDTAKADIM